MCKRCMNTRSANVVVSLIRETKNVLAVREALAFIIIDLTNRQIGADLTTKEAKVIIDACKEVLAGQSSYQSTTQGAIQYAEDDNIGTGPKKEIFRHLLLAVDNLDIGCDKPERLVIVGNCVEIVMQKGNLSIPKCKARSRLAAAIKGQMGAL